MRMRTHGFTLATLFAIGACGGGDLARAEGERLSVEHAATLLAGNLQIRADSQTTRVLAELWVDYTLLTGLLEADSTLGQLDVSLMTRLSVEQRMLTALQEQAIQADTIVDEAELQRRFAADMPGAQIQASHILFGLPQTATQAQRDSVLALASSIGQRARNGDSFATLARNFSADRGSARNGGSLGTFRRGDMLPEIEAAALALSPGEISDPVESSIGVHVVRLDALSIPDFADLGQDFRRQVQMERLAEAEALYIKGLEENAGLEISESGLAAARSLAKSPEIRLSTQAAQRALVAYGGGAYSVREYQDMLRLSPEPFAEQVGQMDDEQLEILLLRLGRQKLLLREAETQGLAPSAAALDSLQSEARAAIVARARVVGLFPDSTTPALVDSTLAQILSGRREIQPLGGITFVVRDQADWSIDESILLRVIEQVRTLTAANGVR